LIERAAVDPVACFCDNPWVLYVVQKGQEVRLPVQLQLMAAVVGWNNDVVCLENAGMQESQKQSVPDEGRNHVISTGQKVLEAGHL
jgi:hypothetical protein